MLRSTGPSSYSRLTRARSQGDGREAQKGSGPDARARLKPLLVLCLLTSCWLREVPGEHPRGSEGLQSYRGSSGHQEVCRTLCHGDGARTGAGLTLTLPSWHLAQGHVGAGAQAGPDPACLTQARSRGKTHFHRVSGPPSPLPCHSHMRLEDWPASATGREMQHPSRRTRVPWSEWHVGSLMHLASPSGNGPASCLDTDLCVTWGTLLPPWASCSHLYEGDGPSDL